LDVHDQKESVFTIHRNAHVQPRLDQPPPFRRGFAPPLTGGCQGPKFRAELAKLLPGLAVEIVKRSDTAQGFEVLARRWVVERTFAWLNRCRRLAKDFENRSRNAFAFIRLASTRLMLRKLSIRMDSFRTGSKNTNISRLVSIQLRYCASNRPLGLKNYAPTSTSKFGIAKLMIFVAGK
jgi:transposase